MDQSVQVPAHEPSVPLHYQQAKGWVNVATAAYAGPSLRPEREEVIKN